MIERSVLSRRRTNGPVNRRSRRGGLVVAVPLDRLGVALLERRPPMPSRPGVGELQDRPQVGEPVLHRRAGDRDPVARRQRADRGGLLGGGVLDRLRLVDDDPAPVDLGAASAASRAASAYVVMTRSAPATASANALPRARSAPWWTCTRRSRGEPGRLPLPVADQRHRADQQRRVAVAGRVVGRAAPAAGPSCPGPCRRRARRRARARCRKSSQARPRSWYGRSVPAKPSASADRASRCSASPDSRSPSQPSASTPSTGRPPGPSSSDGRARSRSPTVSCPSPAEQLQSRGQATASGSSSTHWPRSRTSGVLERGQRRQLVVGQRLVAEGELPLEVDDARPGRRCWPGATVPGLRRGGRVSLGAEPGLTACVHQPGSSTPKPAAASSGAPSRGTGARRRCPGRSAVRPGGAQGVVELRVEPAGPAELGQQGLLRGVEVAGQGAAAAARARQTRSASTTRLGSSVACRAKVEAPAGPAPPRRLDEPEAGADGAARPRRAARRRGRPRVGRPPPVAR